MENTQPTDSPEAPTNPAPSPAKWPLWLTTLSPIFSLGILAKALYAAGVLVNLGYLQGYGVDPGLFTRSAELTYIQAYVGLMELYPRAMSALPWVLIFLMLFASSVIFMFYSGAQKEAKASDDAKDKRPQRWMTKPVLYSIIVSAFIWVVPNVFAVIGLLILALPIPFYEAGHTIALREIPKAPICTTPEKKTPKCTFLFKDKKQIGEGFVINADEDRIALFNKGRSKTYKLDGERIESIPTEPAEEQVKMPEKKPEKVAQLQPTAPLGHVSQFQPFTYLDSLEQQRGIQAK